MTLTEQNQERRQERQKRVVGKERESNYEI
jgi:hypothetical protein